VPDRILAAGARTGIGGLRRIAGTPAVEQEIERAVEAAVVRALDSPATDRAIERALSSPAMERRANEILESELVDKVWERLLASDEAQKLVERIAQAPEVRSAVAYQGVGLINDVGREVAEVTRRIDSRLEKLIRRVLRRRQRVGETDRAGPVSRGLAVGIDLALLNGAAFIASALGANVLSRVANEGVSDAVLITLGALLWGGAGITYLMVFWILAGQTPGMRFLGIQLTVSGHERLSPRLAVRRLFGLVLSILPLGLGVLSILTDERRRGWHDKLAGTEVYYENLDRAAPWSGSDRTDRDASPGSLHTKN